MISCGEVRTALEAAAEARPVSATNEVWTTLVARGAVEGSAAAPQITPVGRHVLGELQVRAYRTDALPLDTVAEHLSRVTADLDQVAKTAQYFLAELGPVTPPEAVPLLRPVAVGLANRRETPEQLAEEFRNIWGSVEVMGGDSRDRLLAAELLNDSSVEMDKVYAPLMNTALRIRAELGERSRAVAAATILHLHPDPTGAPAYPAFISLKRAGLAEEEAALLAGVGTSAADTQARRAAFVSAFADLGFPVAQTQLAASYLTAGGEEVGEHAARVGEIARHLKGRLTDPVTSAALLSSIDWLEPGELVNWAQKAMEIARVRRLAPTDPELVALGIALVYGLPRSEFSNGSGPEASPLRRTAGLLAVHAWVYRPLVMVPAAAPSLRPAPASSAP